MTVGELRRSPAAIVAAFVAAPAVVFTLIAFHLFGLGLLAGLALFAFLWKRTAGGAEIARRMRVTGEGVHLDDHFFPRASIAQAFVVPTPDRTLVRFLRRRGARLDLIVKNAELGRRVLRTLGFDAAHATAAPKLRIALEKAASSHDVAELESALAELEAEEHAEARAAS